MKEKNYILFFVFIIGVSTSVLSQDIHFSQFWTSPLHVNPAQTGFFDGITRLSAQHRTQWKAISKPYQTFSSSIDLPMIKRPYRQEVYGFGANIYRDVAGDSDFGTTQLNLSFSYIKSLNRRNNSFLSFGIQTGAAQRTINYAELYFDEQFHNGRFNPSTGNTETFAHDNFIFGDISAGLNWVYQPRNRQMWNFGLAMFHLNRPKQSLFNDKDVRLDMKIIGTASTSIKPDKDIDLNPMIITSFQGTYKEIIFGGLSKYILDKDPLTYTTLNFGIFYRVADAAYLMMGGEYMRFNFGISYDINMSRLKVASRYKGGWEISISYIFDRYKPRKIKELPCPIF